MKRILTISVICLILVAIVSFVAVRWILRSHQVTQEVQARIETLYGGRVSVGQVDVGLHSTTINGFELFEQGSSGKDAPWLKVAALTLDVSLWDLVRGADLPKRVTLHGAVVSLRFNHAGELLTRFPKPTTAPGSPLSLDTVPEAAIEDSEIILQKAGYPPLAITNVNAHAGHQSDRLVLSATGENAEAGKFSVDGALEKGSRIAHVHVKTAGKVHVTQTLLDRVPCVPPDTWELIQIGAADSTGDVAASYNLDTGDIHYRAELVPHEAKILVPALGLPARIVSGIVTVEDNLIHVRDVKGRAFGGSFAAQGEFDFRGPVSRLKFTRVDVVDLDVNDLPESWNIPAAVRKTIARGKLSGSAALEVKIGAAQIDPAVAAALIGVTAAEESLAGAAMLAGLPAHVFTAEGHGKGQVRDPAGASPPIEFDWQLAPSRSGAGKPTAARQGPMPREDLLAALLVMQGTTLLQVPEAKPAMSPNYLDLNFNVKNASLAEVIRNEEIKLPFTVDGKVSFRVKASIPVDRLGSIKDYKAQGSVQIAQLAVAGATIKEIDADFRYADGTLHLTTIKSTIAGDQARQEAAGTVQGSGRLSVEPLGDLQFDLALDRIPVGSVAELPADKIDGTISGKVSIRGNTDGFRNFKALVGSGTIHTDRLKVFGIVVQKMSASVGVKDGVAKLDEFKLQVDGTPITAAAELHLSDDYSFFAKLDLRNWDVGSLAKVAVGDQAALPPVTGTFTTDLNVEGKLHPFTFKGLGDFKAEDARVDAVTAKLIRFHWQSDGKRLMVKDFDAILYDGKAVGEAVVPIEPGALGNVDLRLHGLDIKKLARDLRVPFAVAGNVDGTVKGTLPSIKGDNPRAATLHVELSSPKLRVQNIPAEQLHGTVEYKQGTVGYKFAGKSLGGTFDLEGKIPDALDIKVPGKEPAKTPKKEPAKNGRLNIKDVRIGRLLQALDLPIAQGVNGRLDLEIHYTHDTPDRIPQGQGTLRISDLRWNGAGLTDDVRGDIILADHQIRLRDLEGDIAGGSFMVRLTYFLRQPERSSFVINLDGVESGQLPIAGLAQKVEGPIQVRVRGNLGRTWRGSAELAMSRGKIAGLDIAQLRVPGVWSFAPSQRRGQFDIYETTAQVSHGRATGKMTLFWDHGGRVEGHVRLDEVDLQDLLRQTIGPSQIGGGRTSARFDFAGTDVHSLNDISGKLTATFSQAQALQVPVLSQLAPFLGIGPSTTFQKGDMRARLDGGVLRIQRLALQGTNAQVFLDGTASLEGRLNLHVVARSGNFGLPTLNLGPIGLRIPPVGPVPLVALEQITAFLSNQVANLKVTGTARSPVIRTQPLAILSEEAVRFLLMRSNSPVTLNQ